MHPPEISVDGDPASGHASNRAGKAGIIPEARDYYVVVPYDYWLHHSNV